MSIYVLTSIPLQVFLSSGVKDLPTGHKFFTKRTTFNHSCIFYSYTLTSLSSMQTAGVKHESGLVEFATVANALEAVAVANHAKIIVGENKHYTLKLSFSTHHSLQSSIPGLDH